MAEPAVTLAEMRRIPEEFPGPDLEAQTAAAERSRALLAPPGALGRMDDIAAWLAAWQERHPPQVRRPRVAVFAGNHGVTARGISAYPQVTTQRLVQAFVDGEAAINQLCESADADLRAYELSLETPTADFTAEPAMTDEACARAMAYGMAAAETGVDLLGLGEVGIGNTTSAAALACALFGGEPGDWVGPGTGVTAAGLARKRAAVADGLARHPGAREDPLEALRCLGGYELAAIAGAVMGARMGRIPVLLDGFAATAAAAVVARLVPGGLDHAMPAHRADEPGHARLLAALERTPLLDLGMRLGEGTGAALALPVVRAAAACHQGMGTRRGAGIAPSQ